MPVQLKVGSGDAVVVGATSLSADVGSGDVEARGIRGLVEAHVGSGDIELEDIGELKVLSVGLRRPQRPPHRARRRGEERRLGQRRTAGRGRQRRVGSIGSGDLDVRDIRGALSVRSVGSGSVDHSAVAGGVSLPEQ